MRGLLRTTALLAATSVAQDTQCSNDDGNWYCQAVHAITYTNVGGAGSYSKITSMDSNNGACSSTPFGYSGSIAPLNEEVSWHVRGPTILKQFAAYTPGSATTRKTRRHEHMGQHAHNHRAHRIQERQVGATVTAVIDGIIETWINEYDGSPPESKGFSNSASSVADTDLPPTPTGSVLPSASKNVTLQAGWGRDAYYDADSQVVEGLVFLNHFGGSGSGVFDDTFGNSLSYASADGTAGAASPQTLQNVTLPSSSEVVLMRDQMCQGDDCGYYRPGTVAYHGWDGARKAFFFEFQMPNVPGAQSNEYDPINMPAIWMLNAQIPRTVQYGPEACSCWSTGCGEFDMFEVLSPGSNKAKSTLHGNKAGGDCNYFVRPEHHPIKVGMVMYDDNVHIKILHSDTEFPSVMYESTILDILGTSMTASKLVSLFSLAESSSG